MNRYAITYYPSRRERLRRQAEARWARRVVLTAAVIGAALVAAVWLGGYVAAITAP